MSYQEYKARQEYERRKAAEQRERDRQIEAERAAKAEEEARQRAMGTISPVVLAARIAAANIEQAPKDELNATKLPGTYAEALAAWNAPELERQKKRQQHRQD